MNDIVPQAGQSDLWEELAVKHQWFHILRAAILDNKIAEMGTTAWAVYCVIKAYTHLDTGESFPGQTKIAGHLGVSVDTVARATDKLIELGLVVKKKVGRHSSYQLIEAVPLERARDKVRVGEAKQEYAPLGFQSFIHQLQEYARSGQLPPGATFNVTLNVTTITQGDHSTVNINQVSVAEPSGHIIRTGAGHSDVIDGNSVFSRLKSI